MSVTLIAYMRQSRAKERTISITEQRRDIEAWAARHDGVRVVFNDLYTEQNVSGSKSWRERELGTALAAVNAGKADGVIVAYQSRLTRENGLGTSEVWAEFGRLDCHYVSVAESTWRQPGTDDADQEMMFAINAAIARREWRRAQANYAKGRRAAIERGCYVGSAPAGYDRTADGNLVVNEYGSCITEAFRMRADGASWRQIASYLTKQNVPMRERYGQRSTRWSLKAAEKALRNEAYLGVARSGEYRNESAHKPLVDALTWKRVQGMQRSVVRGEKREPGMLSGLLVCGTCGHRLTRDYVKRGEKVFEYYRCRNQGACTAPAGASALQLDALAARVLWTRMDGISPAPSDPAAEQRADLETQIAGRRTQLAEVEADIDLPLELAKTRSTALRQAIEALQLQLAALGQEGEALIRMAGMGFKLGDPVSFDSWWTQAPVAAKRDLVRSFIGDRIEVAPGKAPLAERVTVEMAPFPVAA